MQKSVFWRDITRWIHKIESYALHIHLQIQYRAERAFEIIRCPQSSPYLHRGVIKWNTADLIMCGRDTALYVVDKAIDGDKECMIDQRQIDRGAAVDDMEVASQECSS